MENQAMEEEMKIPMWAKVLIFLTCWPASVLGAEVFRITEPTGKDAVRIVLRDGACVDKYVLEYLYENIADDRRFKKAELEWEGKDYGACWVELRGMVITIGSDKEPIKPIPRSAFRDEAI